MSNYDSNEILNYSRQIIKQINHINGNTDQFDDVLELAFAAMISHYGKEAENEIYVAFLKTKFVTCDGSISDLLKKKFNASPESILDASLHAPGTFYEVNGHEYVDKNRKRTYKFDRTVYIQNNGEVDKATLVRSVIHQVNHVLNSINNPVVSVQGSLAARMGISLDKFVSRDNLHLRVEEAINDMQASEIMEEVYNFLLCDNIDERFKSVLDEISQCPRVEKEDDEVTEIIRPLYEDDFFKHILVDRRISGRLNGIRAEFESYTDVGSYGDFLDACFIVATSKDEEEKLQYKGVAKQLVKKYLDVTEEDN